MESHTSLDHPHLAVEAFRAATNMEALDPEMVTGLGIAIETRGAMKKKKLRKITLENRTMASLVTIKRTPSRRVLHALPGKAYLTASMVCK